MTSTDRSPTPVPTARRHRPHPARRARRVVAALSAGSFLVLTGCFAASGTDGSATTTAGTDAGTSATTSPTTPTTTATATDRGWGTSTATPGSGTGQTTTQSSGS